MKPQHNTTQSGIFDAGRPVGTILGLALMFSETHAGIVASSHHHIGASTVPTARAGQTHYTGMPDSRQWEHTHRISSILSTHVRHRHGDKAGEVKDVVLDNNGTIAYAVVSTGGMLGLGSRGAEKDFFIDMDKATLQRAPSFTSCDWPNFADEQWLSNNRRFYRDWVDTH